MLKFGDVKLRRDAENSFCFALRAGEKKQKRGANRSRASTHVPYNSEFLILESCHYLQCFNRGSSTKQLLEDCVTDSVLN